MGVLEKILCSRAGTCFLVPFEFAVGAVLALSAVNLAVSQDRSDSLPEDPDWLVRAVVTNELNLHKADYGLWRYRQRRDQRGETDELEFVETPRGEIERLLARDGQPLSSEEKRKEDARIQELLSSPEAFEKQVKKAEEDGEEEKRLLRMLPAAFEFSKAGREEQFVKLHFQPRPSFLPQRREGTVFHAMEGNILIDPVQLRIAGIEGQLIDEVKFGGGFLGHLAKGGTVAMSRRDVGDGHWELTNLRISMDGRALLFKTISVHESEENSDFQPVRSDITLQEACDLLRQDALSPERTVGNSFR